MTVAVRLAGFWGIVPRPLKIVASRLFMLLPQLFGVMMVTFLLVRLLAGNPALLLLGNMATPETIAAFRDRLGLDLPVWDQFLRYVWNALHGDLRTSIFTSQPVVSDLLERASATLELITYAMIHTILIGVTLAIVSVARPGGAVDIGSRIYGLAAGAIPDFWIGLLLIHFFF
ncbi:ABC transporter permease [Ancylobacter vacuolatus]|uniref:ABC-type dipeptide/oligopeptide/nickel transport system permease component n=1 Tax=Ancylobacter vacuolatus TaxID=223389 RepID=A0ABU0DHT7_9HYPH|nr:ABC transporter permease [Ancylobacter vacuolatus]MDQ0347989.1 ABC-type dipeptide/oligopeptide/nickel transport system permease component [Ancylobacter vacuolatus]